MEMFVLAPGPCHCTSVTQQWLQLWETQGTSFQPHQTSRQVKGLNLAVESPDLHSSEIGLAQEDVSERLQELQVHLIASMPV